MATLVWGLYEKHPGEFGKLVGVFSSINLAKSCVFIQPLLQSDWQYRDVGNSYLWIAQALDPEQYGQESFTFTIEEIEVDRLVEQPKPSSPSF